MLQIETIYMRVMALPEYRSRVLGVSRDARPKLFAAMLCGQPVVAPRCAYRLLGPA